MVNRQTGTVIPVPFHKGRDVSVGLIREIISEAGVTPEVWAAL